jgi:hypothetical protein
MTRLFVGNFDFEYGLARAEHRQLPQSVEQVMRELSTCWIAIADEGDQIWSCHEIEDEFFEQLAACGLPKIRTVRSVQSLGSHTEVYPWGWTNAIRTWAAGWGGSYVAPAQTVVDQVNSRRYSLAWELREGHQLVGSMAVETLDDLSHLLAQRPDEASRWVLKANYGMSARERLLGQGRTLTLAASNWARRRLEADRVLIFEPWVERVEEVGLQITVPWSGPPLLEGITQLLTEDNGQYLGSRFGLDVDLELRWMPAVEAAMRLASEMRAEGYFGPLGIDAVRYRDDEGRIRMRCVQDLNARHTMGRIGLGFRRLLASGEQGSWLHVRWPDPKDETAKSWLVRKQQALSPGVRTVRTSPYEVNGEPTRGGSVVVIAESRTALIAAEDQILADRRT